MQDLQNRSIHLLNSDSSGRGRPTKLPGTPPQRLGALRGRGGLDPAWHADGPEDKPELSRDQPHPLPARRPPE